ncbi:MAG: amino acid adenylation domain-containing protein [Planctomycetes bacterium]|nr:amino acid adenylation domain-containing protein [Planctomycetota bacterium]
MSTSQADLERLSAEQRRLLLADLLRNKQQIQTGPTPAWTADPSGRHDPFPLTDAQYAYWLGQQGLFDLGTVAAHAYFEFESENLDLPRLERAFNRLIGYHDMLRAVIGNDGRQRILKAVPFFNIRTNDLRAAGEHLQEQGLLATRDEMSHQVPAPDRYPLFDIRATFIDECHVRLHISLSLLILDAWSIRILFAQWFMLYDNPDLPLPTLEISFRDYVLAEEAARSGAEYKRAEAYWRDRLSTLPSAPGLPLARDPRQIPKPKFVRLSRTLDEKQWGRLKNAARNSNLTPSGILLAAFGTVLRRWSQNPRFTINATVFNRNPLHPQVLELIGDFTSTMLVAFDGAENSTFLQCARRQQQQFWDDLDHCQYSGIRVLRDLMRQEKRQDSSFSPIVFTSIFGASVPAARILSVGEFVYGISQTPQVWLDHQVMEQGDSLVLTWDAVEDLFPAGLLQDMFETYGQLLHRLAYDPAAWEQKGAIELPTVQHQVRDAANDTAAPLTADGLHTLFFRSASIYSDRPAVIADGQTLDYEALRRQALRLAQRLRTMGAASDRPVAVVMEKEAGQVIAALGILEVGATYLPIDPTWPESRFQQALEIGEIQIAVTTPLLSASLTWPEGVHCVTLENAMSEDIAREEKPVDPERLAYVIFTSGSTGTPKGVMTDHRGAVNTILDLNDRFGIGPDDKILALSALHFDLSVYDMFGLLAAGGTVVMPEAGAVRDPRRWTELIQQERITVWNTVPALMEMLVEHLAGRGTILESLRLVLLSGDWIPVSLPDRIRRMAPHARIIGLGGATEASIWSIHYPIESVDPEWTSIPYGKALRNQSWRVLNADLDDCPTWVPGDLYIGGVGLARGYWRDDRKTAESFFRHPVSGERLYRTGDRGRFLPDGNIEFLGRLDHQVKIRGHRIELGEIESAMASHPAVQHAVAAAVGKDRANRHLVGYVVLRENGCAGKAAEATVLQSLREHVQSRLPCHMTPTQIVPIAKIPLTSNGKLNRDLLPDPASIVTSATTSAAVAPDPIVLRMSELIAKELGLSSVAADANLLHLGADSVDMVRIANRIEAEFGFQPSLAEFFRTPTVNALAAARQRGANQRAEPSSSTALAGLSSQVPQSSSSRLILDPRERERFKAAAPGLRHFGTDTPRIRFERAALDCPDSKMRFSRRSHRRFAATPLKFESVGRLLGNLRRFSLHGAPKYEYGSAGGLYPVQSYVHVKPGRVERMDGGVYYYHPAEHALLALSPGTDIDPDVHEPFVNRGMFEQAAFSIFFITQLRAIEPLYGEHALRFSIIESGLMTQLLETEAPREGIGLCQIGWLDFDRIQPHFHLDNGHRQVHSLVGGPLPEPIAETDVSHEIDSATSRLEDREEGEI